MTLLLRTPAPRPTESLLGHVLRLSEDNGYDSPWHILVQAGIHQREVISPAFPIDKLASVTGRPPAAYESIVYRDPEKTIGYRLLGHSLGESSAFRPLRLRRPACCPCCISETGFIDAFWDLSIAIGCPAHRTMATAACSVCGNVLSWFRPGLLQCKCGASLQATTTSDINEPVLDLMAVVRAKLYGHDHVQREASFLPLPALMQLSLRELIAFIRQFGGFALLAGTGTSVGSEEAVVQAAAESLAGWPHGFHQLLRGLGSLPGARTDSTSIIVRLRGFYAAMLKGRKGHEFLREEFIRFGAHEWGDGLVDARMLPAGIDRRFTSIAELSRRSGIDSRTLAKWAADGKLPKTEIGAGRGTRYVVDASNVMASSGAPGKIIEARRAAGLVGVPVAVLDALNRAKQEAHYEAAHSPAMKRGYRSADIETFRLKLVERAAAAKPLPVGTPVEQTISLIEVMKRTRFGGANFKAAFLGRYLEGAIDGFRPTTDGAVGVIFLRTTVDVEARNSRALREAVSKTDAAKMLACSVTVVNLLVARGHIHSCSEHAGRVLKVSVDAFLERYTPLPRIASQLRTKSKVLLRRADALGLTLLRFQEVRRGRTAFVLLAHAELLSSPRTLDKRRTRAQPVEVFRQYLEMLWRSGDALPRKGLTPNRAEIARVCGIDRGRFSKNELLSELLRSADQQDKSRFKLPSSASPLKRLENYLQALTTSGLPLPRRGGVPNKSKICRACGLSKNALYTTPELLQLVNAHPG